MAAISNDNLEGAEATASGKDPSYTLLLAFGSFSDCYFSSIFPNVLFELKQYFYQGYLGVQFANKLVWRQDKARSFFHPKLYIYTRATLSL